jgi:t-SNARE complex subunit (syntaxin)
MDRSLKHKLNREIMKLTEVMNKIDALYSFIKISQKHNIHTKVTHFQHHSEPSPKLTVFLETKQDSTKARRLKKKKPLHFYCIVIVVVVVVVFKTVFLCVSLAVLELTLSTRLASNSKIHLPLPLNCWN